MRGVVPHVNIVLLVDDDNDLCHRTELPTSEQLTEFVRESLADGDLTLDDLIDPRGVRLYWASELRERIERESMEAVRAGIVLKRPIRSHEGDQSI